MVFYSVYIRVTKKQKEIDLFSEQSLAFLYNECKCKDKSKKCANMMVLAYLNTCLFKCKDKPKKCANMMVLAYLNVNINQKNVQM